MTLTPVRTVPDRLQRPSTRAIVAALLADLAAVGLHARVLTEWIAGEPDIRVQVWHDAGAATVELLWVTLDAALPIHIDAVRIQDDDRAVWRNRHARCADADIVRFLCDLLLLDTAALEDRYLLLG